MYKGIHNTQFILQVMMALHMPLYTKSRNVWQHINQLTLPALKRRGFFLHPSNLPLPIAGSAVEVRCPEAFCNSRRPRTTCFRVPPGTVDAHRAKGHLSVRREERLCQTQQRFDAAYDTQVLWCATQLFYPLLFCNRKEG